MKWKKKKPVEKLAKANINGDKMKARKIAKPLIQEKMTSPKDTKKVDDGTLLPKALKRDKTVGGPMQKVQAKIFGGKTVKRSFLRTFETPDEAKRYIETFLKGRKYNTDKSGRMITFPGSIDSIYLNRPLFEVMARTPVPKEGLPEIIVAGESSNVITMPKPADAPRTSAAVRERRTATGELIPLKKLCQELNVEPRAARMKLRRAVKDDKKYPALAKSHAAHARWEWEKDSAALDDVRKALGGK